MGFIKAFAGAIGGSFADQWKDFYSIPPGINATVGICPAVKSTVNVNRSSNTRGNANILTNGSLILIPEGFALITMENSAITGFVSDPGGYQWMSNDVNSQSFFSGGGLMTSLIKQSWERFKFGGAPGASQMAFYVNLKEIPNNRFGTHSEIYWDDAYMNTQVGALAHGTYTLKISDPILFLKSFVPAEYYSDNGTVFDFADYNNAAAEQLFNEVIGSLAGAFSAYANDANKQNRMAGIQRDSVGFAHSLAQAVELNYHWEQDRGLKIVKAVLMSIEYDVDTKELMSKVRQADALMGARGNANLQAAFAQGIQSAGKNPAGGALGMGFMGMGMQGVAGTVEAMQQPFTQQAYSQSEPSSSNTQHQEGTAHSTATPQNEDPYEKLAKLKGLLDQGVISQEDFNAAKSKLLGI
jgi:membrane protease subunit (stomatin/prohibitin family)